MNDPIVDEVRRIREEHAARFNYDVDAIFQGIKERERKSGLVFVDGVARQVVADPESRLPSQSPKGLSETPSIRSAG
jgi:hypothetical protein